MKKLLIGIIMISLAGCGKSNDVKLKINCNGDKFTVEAKNNNTFTCGLINKNYIFTLSNIKNNSITIDVSDGGLSLENENGGISLRGEYKKFTIKKNNKIKLVTQTTDYNEDIVIEWKTQKKH